MKCAPCTCRHHSMLLEFLAVKADFLHEKIVSLHILIALEVEWLLCFLKMKRVFRIATNDEPDAPVYDRLVLFPGSGHRFW